MRWIRSGEREEDYEKRYDFMEHLGQNRAPALGHFSVADIHVKD